MIAGSTSPAHPHPTYTFLPEGPQCSGCPPLWKSSSTGHTYFNHSSARLPDLLMSIYIWTVVGCQGLKSLQSLFCKPNHTQKRFLFFICKSINKSILHRCSVHVILCPVGGAISNVVYDRVFYPIICQLLGLSGSMNSLGTKQKRFFSAETQQRQRQSFAIAKQVDFFFFFTNVLASHTIFKTNFY